MVPHDEFASCGLATAFRSVGKAVDADLASRAAALSAALSKLPDRRGPVFRGAALAPEQIASYTPGTTRTEPAFLSTSADHTRDFPGNTWFVVDSRHAKDVSSFSSHQESEVVFDKGTSFYLIGNGLDPRSGRQVITMMEATDLPHGPTKGEIRAAEKRVHEFLKKINAVPEADRQPLTSDKYAGPIAEIVVG